MAEKFADLENKKITVGEAKAFAGMASVIVNISKLELIKHQLFGEVTKSIDFLEAEYKNPQIRLADEFKK